MFYLTELASKNIIRVDEGTIEQYADKGPLKIAPLTSKTC